MEGSAELRITIAGKTRVLRPGQVYDDETAKQIIGLGKTSEALDNLDSATVGKHRLYEGQVLIDYVNSLFKKKPK